MGNEETVCAVVVTYNRKELLIDCLKALEIQKRTLNGLFIVDNASTDQTPQLLEKEGYLIEKPPYNLINPWESTCTKNGLVISYIRMQENTGGAGGFFEGIKRAYESGYDWIWVMDDDVKPDKCCLSNLMKNRLDYNILLPLRVSLLGDIEEYAAIKYDLTNPFIYEPRRLTVKDKFRCVDDIPGKLEVQDFPFEGPLINQSVISTVGYPRKDFFIFADDTEYSLRITYLLNEKIILIKDALMIRMKNLVIEKQIDWKTYYSIRNVNVILLKYGDNSLVKIRLLISLGAWIIYCIVNSQLNKRSLKIVYYAFLDSFQKELYNRYKPYD